MSCLPALENFLQNYRLAYQESLDDFPRCYPHGEDSDCIQGDWDLSLDEPVTWLPVSRLTLSEDGPADFSNVEHALELTLWRDINEFYGHFYAAPLMFHSPWGTGELLQAWNAQDFQHLQQNIIGHLMMKKKLKQAPTWFIGVLDEGDKMLIVDNQDGSVWIEVPGDVPREKLADNLAAFIAKLAPRVAPPILHQEASMPALEHPGIRASFKRMWQNLTGKR